MMMRTLLWCAVSTKAQANENESLPEQQANMIARAEQLDLHVIDTLLVPGHSRRYIDIHECAADMMAAKPPVTAYADLLKHWERKDFDVLMCRDGSRFARTQSLHAYVVERTIETGARIYSMADGWVDKTNFRMMIAMGGYSASKEVDEMLRRTMEGKKARAKHYLFTSGQVPATHKRVLDSETGKTLRIEPRPEAIAEFERLSELMLDGVPYSKLQLVMHARYGYGDGAPHYYSYYYNFLFSPTTWGHYSRGITSSTPCDIWRIEQGHTTPAGISIDYNVLPSVISSATRAPLIAEIKRRIAIRGKQSPDTRYWTQGLVVCDDCGANMRHQKKPNIVYLMCVRNQYMQQIVCHNRTVCKTKTVQAYVMELLDIFQKGGGIPALKQDAPITLQPDAVQAHIDTLSKQIKALLIERAKFPDLAADTDSLLQEYSNQRKALQADLSRHEARQVANDVPVTLPTGSLESFWRQTPIEINQWLHRLLHGYRIAVRGDKVVGLKRVSTGI